MILTAFSTSARIFAYCFSSVTCQSLSCYVLSLFSKTISSPIVVIMPYSVAVPKSFR